MAAALPAKLKTADIHRFALRAAQLEKFRPIVTYWCEYYILQQVLSKGLHTSDEECSNYAVQLMDKLEATKTTNASNDAIVDDVAAKAYIENFALDTFKRADDAQRSNKVTKQTADTFMAAATFLDLLSIWGEVDREITVKSKFAKFHAARILKAFKAGEDPNATNPVAEEPLALPDDSIDAELKALEHQQNGPESGVYRPPTVESAPNSGMPSRPESTLPGEAVAPPPLPKRTPNDMAPPPAPPQNEYKVSPIEPVEPSTARQDSAGGGYFPTASPSQGDVHMTGQNHAPSQPSEPPLSPHDFYNVNAQPPAPPTPPPGSLGMTSPAQPSAPPLVQSPPAPQIVAQTPTVIPPASHVPAPIPQVVQQAPPIGSYRTDDEATLAAQKHARWAISALNFEDVNTAVKELRLALQSLGAG